MTTRRPVPELSSPGVNLAAFALAGAIAMTLIGSVTGLFVNDGRPFEHLVSAERACNDQVFVSERADCTNAVIARSGQRVVALH